jgi:thiol-disulfide isomerase/thioredoxin
VLTIGTHSYAVRLFVPSINDPFYSLSAEIICLIDMNGDGNFSWKWQLADSGQTIVPTEQVALTSPFSVHGNKLRATAIDSAGTIFRCSTYNGDTAAVVGFLAPDFSFNDSNGTRHDLSAMRGKIVLVTFWSTSCTFCEKIRTDLNALVQRSDTAQFQSISPAADTDIKSIAAFVKEKPYEGIITPYDASIWNMYNRRMTTPVYYIIDRDGAIIFSGAGASMMAIVDRLVTTLLRNHQ